MGEKLSVFDYSPFNVVVFDNVYMSNLYVLDKVRRFIKENLDIIVIATGDVKQLQDVEVITNYQIPIIYMGNYIDIVFKYNIFLQIYKRVGAKDNKEGERNREIINNIYNDFCRNILKWLTIYWYRSIILPILI